jgi:hypothetical protein
MQTMRTMASPRRVLRLIHQRESEGEARTPALHGVSTAGNRELGRGHTANKYRRHPSVFFISSSVTHSLDITYVVFYGTSPAASGRLIYRGSLVGPSSMIDCSAWLEAVMMGVSPSRSSMSTSAPCMTCTNQQHRRESSTRRRCCSAWSPTSSWAISSCSQLAA